MTKTISTSHGQATAVRPGLPVAVQLSFAGSRALLDARRSPQVDPKAFEQALQVMLRDRIEALGKELGLTDRHFWCGLSQIAIGGDTVFTRACTDLEILQRIYLPQPRDEFLNARDEVDGTPDFLPEEQTVARELLEDPHIIQERVVATAVDRQARFAQVNRELARVADVLICLVRSDAVPQPGGSLDLVEQARKRGRPLLAIRLGVGPDGRPVFEREEWYGRELFKLPSLPHELGAIQTEFKEIPPVRPYCTALLEFAGKQASGRQTLFKYSALIIVGTHFGATLCAVLALWLHTNVSQLLVIELLLLATGQLVHHQLHRRHAAAAWGITRLVSELARSVQAMASVRTYLSHLFVLPIPESLSPLLRTLDILHLRDSHRLLPATLIDRRDQYVRERLLDHRSGQIPYYDSKSRSATRWLKVANRVFLFGSFSAFAATLLKLLLHSAKENDSVWTWLMAHHELDHDFWHHVLGSLAVLLPVVAVAAMSLAASLDLEARASTYQEMLIFLRRHGKLLEQATSESEFAELAIECETRLLSETATWYFRRSYTSVA
jgi:hypothetical protein